MPLALVNARHGRLEAAARIAGFDAANQTRTGENASVVAPLLNARLEPLLAAGLAPDKRARLVAEGAALHEDEAFRLALGD